MDKPLQDIAKEVGVAGEHIEELVHDDKVNSAVLKQVQDAGKKAGLAGIEIISGIVLAEEEWTPQNVSKMPSQNLRQMIDANIFTRVSPRPLKS